MDYEKRYKDALERAKKLYGQGTITESLGFVFPELNEKSYGERIRKGLIEHIKANKEADYVLFKKFSPDDVIAWLEKQNKTLDPDKVIEWLTANVRLYASLNSLYGSNCPQGDVEVESLIKSFKKEFGL